MVLLLVLVTVLWSVLLLLLVCLCRAAHLEDVARGFVDEPALLRPAVTPVTALPALVRAPVLTPASVSR